MHLNVLFVGKIDFSLRCIIILDHQSMDIEEQEPTEQMEQEQQIMILIDGLDDNQEDQDLLQQLVAEPTYHKQPSFNYDYKPAPIQPPTTEQPETTELKTSNRSTSTCADTDPVVRRCFCTKTGCRKNYCECFKMGEACTPDCECVACGNSQRLFLSRSNREVTKCKCQKSHCLKKYCQCHSSGKKCGSACKCFECENIEEIVKEQKQEEKLGNVNVDHLMFFNI